MRRREVNEASKYKPMNKILGKYAPSMSNFFWVLSNSSYEENTNGKVLCHVKLTIIIVSNTTVFLINESKINTAFGQPQQEIIVYTI